MRKLLAPLAAVSAFVAARPEPPSGSATRAPSPGPQLQNLVSAAAPTLVACPGSGSTPPGGCWSPPATTLNGYGVRPPSPTCAAPPPSPLPRAAPTATGSTAAATATPGAGRRHAVLLPPRPADRIAGGAST